MLPPQLTKFTLSAAMAKELPIARKPASNVAVAPLFNTIFTPSFVVILSGLLMPAYREQ
ncbi:hypothetical protein QNM99_23405 [Pseudomonas sp. PCH446]